MIGLIGMLSLCVIGRLWSLNNFGWYSLFLPDRTWHKVRWQEGRIIEGLGEEKVGPKPRLEPGWSMQIIGNVSRWAKLDMDPNMSPGQIIKLLKQGVNNAARLPESGPAKVGGPPALCLP